MGSHQQTKMGEGNKQVRVDNWGIFFLQRLQMFFNKTDYCDLTLQFEGNVQLKVHRLVMNACTEYFQFLEQTCETIDDVLIMPSDLQADVVLPIVNFMYTGMLEFHMSIFDKLYKTAEMMNITVLTKLLDAQKSPIAPLPKSVKKNAPVPHTWNLQGKKIVAKTDSDLPATLPGRKLPVWKRKSAPVVMPHPVSHYLPEPRRSIPADPLAIYDNAPKPTRFEWPDEDLSSINLFDSSFDDISYTSKPLLTQDDEPKPSTSFDRIKDTTYNSRKSSNYTNSAVDIDDVKDYVKEQKIRSNLAESDDEDATDDVENYESNRVGRESLKRSLDKINPGSDKRVRFSVNEKENQIKTTKINISPNNKTFTEVNHTKIISEVLKKYPHLVKKNKNIRLKILAKSGNSSSDHSSKMFKTSTSKMRVQLPSTPPVIKNPKVLPEDEKKHTDGPWKCHRCSTPTESCEFVLYYLYRKHMTDVHNEKFDSRMCKYCGHKCSKHNMLMYHQYTKHGIKPPAAYNFPKCSLCPYIALTETLLIKHKLNHTKFELQCSECKVAFSNQHFLTSHIRITGHTGKSGKTNYDCQYCTKKYQSGANLFSHIKMQHRDEARRDGIVSIDEIEDVEEDEQDNVEDEAQEHIEEEEEEQPEYITPEIMPDVHKDKIKILSNVKVPSVQSQHDLQTMEQANVQLEPSSEAEALSNVASGIATSLGLVDIVVLDDNQQYILHSGDQQLVTDSQPEFILPELTDTQTFTTGQHLGEVITTDQNLITQSMLSNSDITSTDELVMVLTDHDYGDGNNEVINNDNSNIVVVYSHPVEGQENQFITSQSNLMINSQTGLIELRNPNSIATTTSQQFVTNTANNDHIESIEMIKREIDSHSDVKNEHYSEELKANHHVITTSSHTIIQPVSENVEILDNRCPQNTGATIILDKENENITELERSVLSSTVEFNTPEDMIAMHEDVTDIPDGSTSIENSQEAVTEDNISETNRALDEEQPMEVDDDLGVDVPPEICTSDVVQEQTDQQNNTSENDDLTSYQKENVSAETEDSKSADEQTESGDISQNAEVNEIALKSTECMDEPMEVDGKTLQHNLSEEVEKSECIPSVDETDGVINEQNEMALYNITEEPSTDHSPSEDQEEEEGLGSEKMTGENTEKDEFADNQQVPIDNTPEENIASQDGDEENSHNETQDTQSVNSQMQDENSQTSQSSSSQKEETTAFMANSSQSAKIILDDWDDTDSQQSENARAGNTVHRLIDDWADDDDDDVKKSSH